MPAGMYCTIHLLEIMRLQHSRPLYSILSILLGRYTLRISSLPLDVLCDSIHFLETRPRDIGALHEEKIIKYIAKTLREAGEGGGGICWSGIVTEHVLSVHGTVRNEST